ncbi:hypothetical protein TNCV_2468861 [Trichonephila clavipes]|nr:hypothetical protein TNCV_2468861 [Trichonephila clavipes]
MLDFGNCRERRNGASECNVTKRAKLGGKHLLNDGDMREIVETLIFFFKEIACRKKSTPCSKLVMRIVYGRDLCNAAMKYGLANEEIARKQYEREYSTEVKICGLFVDKDKPFCVLHPMDWLVMMDS